MNPRPNVHSTPSDAGPAYHSSTRNLPPLTSSSPTLSYTPRFPAPFSHTHARVFLRCDPVELEASLPEKMDPRYNFHLTRADPIISQRRSIALILKTGFFSQAHHNGCDIPLHSFPLTASTIMRAHLPQLPLSYGSSDPFSARTIFLTIRDRGNSPLMSYGRPGRECIRTPHPQISGSLHLYSHFVFLLFEKEGCALAGYMTGFVARLLASFSVLKQSFT